MQEVKIDIVPNNPGTTAQVLQMYLKQGYNIDAFSVETTAPTAQTKTVTTVIQLAKVGQWN